MKILFNDLKSQNIFLKEAFLERLDSIFENSSYILDKNVQEFEKSFSKFSNRKFSIGVSSGTDAIKLCVKSFSPCEDTLVITQANTFVATATAILDACSKVTLELVDVDKHYQMDCEALEETLVNNKKNYKKCIVIPVNMYGHTFDKEKILDLKKKYDFYIVEDCSQAHGSKFKDGTLSGTVGECSAFSLYPGKNLGSIGDAGIVNTNSEERHNEIKAMRNYGSKKKYHHDSFGYNHRLDPIQAAFLCEKIKYIEQHNSKRNKIGQRYINEISNPKITNFTNAKYCDYNTFHIYPILTDDRENFCRYLEKMGIQSGIHYPIPIEKMSFFLKYNFDNQRTIDYSRKLVSLPIHPFMTTLEIDYVIKAINNF